MALPVNIVDLINGQSVEWDRLEFKKGWNPKKIMHTMCAFANDINNWGGGYIIIGVDENNGTPVLPPCGIKSEDFDSIQQELLGLYYKIQPNYFAITQPYILMGKQILVIWVPAGDHRVYNAPDNLGNAFSRYPYIRQGSQTIIARSENLQRLQGLTARIPFDDRINQTAEINNLDLGIIQEFLFEVKSELYEESKKIPFEDLCRQMHIAKGPDEYLKPINAGLLLFSKNPEKYFSRAWIELVDHTKKTGSKIFTEKYFKGPIHLQLENTLDYIENFVVEEITVKQSRKAKSEKFYNYPYEAIEEALSNAVYHKSYEIGKPIEVQILEDRITILSYPGPVPPVDAHLLATQKRIVARDYRNRRIGDFLKELGLTEGRSTGIPLIYSSMEDNASLKPILETDADCNYFMVTLPVKDSDSDHDSDHDSDYDGDYDINDRIFSVLRFCLSPKSKEDILTNLGLTVHYKNYLSYMKPSIDNGWLVMTIPDKPKSKHQKYITTIDGLNAMKTQK